MPLLERSGRPGTRGRPRGAQRRCREGPGCPGSPGAPRPLRPGRLGGDLMSAHTDRFWRERMAVRYLDALDAGDLDTIVALWEQAAADEELNALLLELNEGLHEEEGSETDFTTDAARVLELARKHL